ncbi:invertase fragment, truncated protein [Escherichia coli]|uniref:Invertase, truncated protein n=12 Tax=Enterobacteriaceae TaxID=543 RepID=A0A447X2G5_ECOLX|nr:invertase fragment, truncated protein [Escherichia coli]
MRHLAVLLEELCERGINFRALTLPIFAQHEGTKAVKVKQSAISMLLCDFYVSRRYSSERLCKSFFFRRLHVERKEYAVFPEKIDFFIQSSLQQQCLKKMPHSYAEYHHFIMMSLMSGEHNTLALSLQDESPGLVPVG